MSSGLAGAASRGAVTVLVGQWLKFAVQLATVAILARLITPADFGRYAMVLAIAGLATLLSDFGLSLAAMRASDLSVQQRSNLFWANVGLGALAAGLVAAAAVPISLFYDDPLLVDVCRVLAVTFVVQAASAQLRAELAKQLRLARSTSCDVVAAAGGLLAAIAFALAGTGVWALVAQQLAQVVIQLILLIAATRWLPLRPRRTPGMRALFRFGAHTGGVQLVNYVTANTDTVLLGRFWGPGVVGVYNQAYQIFKVPLQQLAAPMTQVAVPVLSRLQGDRFRSYVLRAHLVLSYLLCGAFLTSAALAIPLLDLLLGPQWAQAPVLFAILAAGGVFQGLGYVYYWVFVSRGLTGVQLKFAMVSRGLMVALLCAATPFGATGVAVASSVGLALNWVILSVFALPHADLRWRDFVRVAIRPVIMFTSMFAIVFPIGLSTRHLLSPLLQLPVMAGSAAIWLLLFALLRPGVRADVATIVATARRARKAKLT